MFGGSALCEPLGAPRNGATQASHMAWSAPPGSDLIFVWGGVWDVEPREGHSPEPQLVHRNICKVGRTRESEYGKSKTLVVEIVKTWVRASVADSVFVWTASLLSKVKKELDTTSTQSQPKVAKQSKHVASHT